MAAEANPDCNNTDSCYCWACHAMRQDVYRGRRLEELERDLRTAFLDEENFNDRAFSEVLKQICISKAFKVKVNTEYHSKYLKPFFKTVWNETDDEAKKKATKINNNCLVYDHWETILNNLSSCPLIKLKQLSANQLFLARRKGWCFSYNELQRSRSNRPALLAYTEEEYHELLTYVRRHPVLQSIDRSEENNRGLRDISALTLRLTRDLQYFR